MKTETVISIRGLTKRYGKGPGGLLALDDVDLDVPRGAVYGLLGRNGAGKSTLIRILIGLLHRTAGDVTILGGDPADGDESRLACIGYMSESMEIPGWMRIGEAIELCAALEPHWDRADEARLIAELELDRGAYVGNLSGGQRRKVGLLLALAKRPELLILDEPAASLDTVVRREFLEQVVDLLQDRGTTVFYSSHILSDVERIADHVGIIDRGRMMLVSRLDDLLDSARRVRLTGDAGALDRIDLFGAVRTQRLGAERLVTVVGFDPGSVAELPPGVHADVMPIGLEDLFIDLVREREVVS